MPSAHRSMSSITHRIRRCKKFPISDEEMKSFVCAVAEPGVILVLPSHKPVGQTVSHDWFEPTNNFMHSLAIAALVRDETLRVRACPALRPTWIEATLV